MHIQDGFMIGKWAAGWYGVSAVFAAKGIYDIKKRSREIQMFKPLLGLFSAAVFFISLLPVPLPGLGTSSHAAGTPLAAILAGPYVTTVLSIIALLLQAAFFGHGGFTTLGANTFSMGVVGSFAGFGLFRLGRKMGLSLGMAACIAAIFGDLAVYVTTSFQLAYGGLQQMSVMTFIWVYMPTQLPISILEGLVTGGMVRYIARVRPDILVNLGINDSHK
ncbi:MAG TPA: energy-coupling factor ABC transporter permease [Desulfobacteria bacterium]|nr:energy-coupling factor ABC transporter permease [Desulfobacteria bacterium]